MSLFQEVKGLYNFDSAQFCGISSLKMRGDLTLNDTGFILPSTINYGQMGDRRALVTGYGSIENVNDEARVILRLLRFDRSGVEPQVAMQLSQSYGGTPDISGIYQGQIFDINTELLQQLHAKSTEAAIRTNLNALLEKLSSEKTIDSLALTCNFEKKQF